MSEQARTPGVSPAARMAAGALVTSVWNSEEPFNVCVDTVAGILAQLEREAQVAILEVLSRELCTRSECGPTEAIHDALLRLRQSESAPGER